MPPRKATNEANKLKDEFGLLLKASEQTAKKFCDKKYHEVRDDV